MKFEITAEERRIRRSITELLKTSGRAMSRDEIVGSMYPIANVDAILNRFGRESDSTVEYIGSNMYIHQVKKEIYGCPDNYDEGPMKCNQCQEMVPPRGMLDHKRDIHPVTDDAKAEIRSLTGCGLA